MKNVEDKVRWQFINYDKNQLRDLIQNQVDNQIENQIDDQIVCQIFNQVFVPINNQLWIQAYWQINHQVLDKIKEIKL
jgi:hypothetical protein